MEQFFKYGLAESIQRTYAAAKRRYLHFCNLYSFNSISTSEHVLCQYVAHLSIAGLIHITIKCYLSAVHHLQIAERRGDPGISNMPRLEQVMWGVKRTQAKGGKNSKERLPISVEILANCIHFGRTVPQEMQRCCEQRHQYASLGFFDLES